MVRVGHPRAVRLLLVGLSAVQRSHAALSLTRAEAHARRPSRLTRAQTGPLGAERLTRTHADLLVLGSESPTRVEPNPLRPECPAGAKASLTSADSCTGADAYTNVR